MDYKQFVGKFCSFIKKHSEIIDEYEASIEEIDSITDNIRALMESIYNITKVDFESTLKSSFEHALETNSSILDILSSLKIELSINPDKKTSLGHYFDEINKIYEENDNDYNIEYCPENRDKLIAMNLKNVIAIAKRYQGLGVDLDDLIGAGNLGLVIAYDKFDPSRARLKDNLLEILDNVPQEVLKSDEIFNIYSNYFTYGDIKEKFHQFFKDGEYTRKDIRRWINKNIRNAKFSSVAAMWIRAYILIEIDNNSRLVKKSKSDINKDREENGVYTKEVKVNLDQPMGGDSETTFGDMIPGDIDAEAGLEIEDSYNEFKGNLALLLDGVKLRDRMVLFKKFGIGLPRPMLPREIADQENLSIARVSQIIQQTVEKMRENQVKHNINPEEMYELLEKMS